MDCIQCNGRMKKERERTGEYGRAPDGSRFEIVNEFMMCTQCGWIQDI